MRVFLQGEMATEATTYRQSQVIFLHLIRQKKRALLAQLERDLYKDMYERYLQLEITTSRSTSTFVEECYIHIKNPVFMYI